MKQTLIKLEPLDFNTAELRTEAADRAEKMSIQGIQTKLSAILQLKGKRFRLVSQGGRYILKPQSEYYPELPENEAITMTLAETIGIKTPQHGLVNAKDNSKVYFVKRFDRRGRHTKLAVEDFAQLSQRTRDTKYDSSMEQIANILTEFCSFPKVEAVKLCKLILFNFLIGNEDMHLKNFSLITIGKKTTLSPAYDLLNTTIAQKNTKEELALPLNGKKNNLKKKDFLDYFSQRLQLNDRVILKVMQDIKQAIPTWKKLISSSDLSKAMQEKYIHLLESRCQRLEI
jgi:serine/threonine-protein kinase HipA